MTGAIISIKFLRRYGLSTYQREGKVSDDRKLRIAIGDFTISGILYDCAMPNIVCDHLPLSGEVSLWGDEIYFDTNTQWQELEDSNEVVELVQIAYLPLGRAFCMFFGRIPASVGF